MTEQNATKPANDTAQDFMRAMWNLETLPTTAPVTRFDLKQLTAPTN